MTFRVKCPVCQTTMIPMLRIGILAVCSTCAETLAVNGGGSVRPAMTHDTILLSPSELARIVRAKSAVVARREAGESR